MIGVAGAWLGWVGVFVTASAGAYAAEPRDYGAGTVKSVDGPGLLTLDTTRGPMKMRLAGIDLPGPGECGATESTAALRGFVRRAPRRVRYDLIAAVDGPLVRDASGRYLARVSYSTRRSLREFHHDLVRADWARVGVTSTLDDRTYFDANLVDGTRNDDDAIPSFGEGPRARRGLWARCGGLAHLPLDTAAPTTAAVPWSVDPNGITSAIGPVRLSPVLAPTTAQTLGSLASVGRVEVARVSGGCRAWLPSLQLRVFAYARSDAPCREAYVSWFRSSGPEGAVLSPGGALGRPVSELRTHFPRLADVERAGNWSLSGDAGRQWAWQTMVVVGPGDRAVGVVTVQAPDPPRG